MGHRLFETLFADPKIRALYETTRRAARPGLFRLRLTIDPDAEGMQPVCAVPWELLYDRDRGDRIACEGGSLIRSFAMRRPPRPYSPPKRIRVLVLLSGATDLELDQESETLEELAETASGLEVVTEVVRNLKALEDLLERAADDGRPFHAVHFAGHGRIAEGPRGGVLVWEPRGAPVTELSGRDLSALLRQFPELQMVVLNACTTAEVPGDGRDPYTGFAAALSQGGIPTVVAVQGVILDQAALLFTRTFYSRLARGANPEAAMSEARRALWLDDPEGVEWAKPVLFQTASHAPRLPGWLLEAVAILAVALLLLAGMVIWQYGRICNRTLDRSVRSAQALLLDHRPAEAARTLEAALGERCRWIEPAIAAAAQATLAAAAQDLGDLRAAVNHARQAVRHQPASSIHQYNLGALLARAGRTPDAVAPLRRATALDPSSSAVRNELGRVYLELGWLDDARRVFHAALEETEESALVRKNLGRALLALDRPREAVQHLEQAIELLPRSSWPERADAWLHLARAQIASGDVDRACDALGAVRAADPEAATGAAAEAANLAGIHCSTARRHRGG